MNSEFQKAFEMLNNGNRSADFNPACSARKAQEAIGADWDRETRRQYFRYAEVRATMRYSHEETTELSINKFYHG